MKPRAIVLVLPGGRVRSDEASRWWQLANVRMMLVAAALRWRLGRGVEVRRVQYRLRGWNSPRYDAVVDATAVLDSVRRRFDAKNIVLVGHSMGGRVATRLAAGGQVGAVVALAPYWPRDDGDLIPPSTRLLVVHGTADARTDPEASRIQTLRARERGLDAQWVGIAGAGHSMLRPYFEWHRRTVDFVSDYLQ
ncbi:MAG: alpha/beta fold hydrolase [Actinomycetota bacterium]|uniref:Alpha/beta fold hydrolase n=1 Tax=Mycobacterium lentiflavum TaxID=141349 RepID=A0ABY3ULN7_MYCLN|nr:alpha/beta fold hydrolase [Mycobacterium lentiflavum]MEE3062496.1 alpha/beta fold hydrolase [Actinomycetota bacterium]ULP40524.1 alpha/beta fold hydrolase [Mycobacterium lentiflavum]